MREDTGLVLSLISYELIGDNKHSFEMSEINTYSVTSLIDPDKRILNLNIEAYNEGEYVDENVFKEITTVYLFNEMIEDNDFDIVNCTLHIDDDLQIQTHDDGEVIIVYDKSSQWELLIHDIFKKYNLSADLLRKIKLESGVIFEINSKSEIICRYSDFDELIQSKGW